MLDVPQILEEIQMVGLYIQNHRHSGIKAEEAVAVFAGFQNNGVAVAHPVARVEQRQCAADHHGGVLLRRHKNVGAHGGGGGFAVGAGDAQGVWGSCASMAAPGLGPLIDGECPGRWRRRSPGCRRGRRRCGSQNRSLLSFPRCGRWQRKCPWSADA